MIWPVIVFSFVKLISLKHKGHTHTRTHAADHQYACMRVCVNSRECVRVCARVVYSRKQMVRILLCLDKAAMIKSQTAELNHKYWEILLLTWHLT